jgi:4-alpha-glucanotransferase
MGLHRLFWIPKGMEPRDGVYVRYAAEEFYAILSLESHRHQSIILGENLGTVPPAVNNSMKRHGIHQMYVVQYELTPKPGGPLRPVPSDSVASLNTHDMPPFHAYCQGQDLPGRLAMGLLDKKEAEAEHKTRRALVARLTRLLQRQGRLARTSSDALSVVKACWAHLAASPARVVLVNLEDLWLETEPQNVPGLGEGGNNWLQKTRHGFDVFSQMPQVVNVLGEVNRLRTLRRSGRKDDKQKGKSFPKKGEGKQKKRLHARPI